MTGLSSVVLFHLDPRRFLRPQQRVCRREARMVEDPELVSPVVKLTPCTANKNRPTFSGVSCVIFLSVEEFVHRIAEMPTVVVETEGVTKVDPVVVFAFHHRHLRSTCAG